MLSSNHIMLNSAKSEFAQAKDVLANLAGLSTWKILCMMPSAFAVFSSGVAASHHNSTLSYAVIACLEDCQGEIPNMLTHQGMWQTNTHHLYSITWIKILIRTRWQQNILACMLSYGTIDVMWWCALKLTKIRYINYSVPHVYEEYCCQWNE